MALSRNGKRLGMAAHMESVDNLEYIKSIQGQAHPRDIKLEQLHALMGDAYYEWYERNRYTSPVARWEKLIDDTISEYRKLELVKGRYSCPTECILTPAGHMAYDAYYTERGDALREGRYGKGL
jgi:hypothetical protein